MCHSRNAPRPRDKPAVLIPAQGAAPTIDRSHPPLDCQSRSTRYPGLSSTRNTHGDHRVLRGQLVVSAAWSFNRILAADDRDGRPFEKEDGVMICTDCAALIGQLRNSVDGKQVSYKSRESTLRDEVNRSVMNSPSPALIPSGAV